jgi:hypothetical protein
VVYTREIGRQRLKDHKLEASLEKVRETPSQKQRHEPKGWGVAQVVGVLA